MELIDWVIERQRESGISSDARFARQVLGISKAMYSEIKTGKKRVTPGFVVKVQAAYPGRCAEILALYQQQAA